MIVTHRLVIETISGKDFQRFYEINSDPKTNLFNPHGSMSYDVAKEVFADMLNHWEEKEFGIWKISERETPHYAIGFGGLSNRKYGKSTKLNLGFRFDTNYWGRGYATEFANRAIIYGFEELHKDNIYGLVRPQNISSIKVLEKCNMHLHGSLSDVPNEEDSLIYKIERKNNIVQIQY